MPKRKWNYYDYGANWLVNCDDGGFYVPTALCSKAEVEKIVKALNAGN